MAQSDRYTTLNSLYRYMWSTYEFKKKTAQNLDFKVSELTFFRIETEF